MIDTVNPAQKLIAIVGPTASGKTDVALEIAQHFSGEIIIADSRQIYKGIDISSNKITLDKNLKINYRGLTPIIEGIPYHGLNIVEPNEILTVQQWRHVTLQTIEGILKKKHLPIIEGGTGLYVSAVLDNYDFADAPPNPEIRKQIEKRISRDGLAEVVHELLKHDPESAEFLDTKNPRRVIRALEVIKLTGKPLSEQRGQGPKLFDDLRIGIKWDIDALDERIKARARIQFNSGLESEARRMLKAYDNSLPSMSSIGYLEWLDYFNGEINIEDVLQRNIARNKKLARSQIKWFKRDKSIKWVTSTEEAVALTKTHLS